MLATVKFGENLLEISKIDGKYEVLTNQIDDVVFVQRVLYLLTCHGDVFAAYYASAIYEDDVKKMLLIHNFEAEIDKYSISAIEVEATDEKHDWGFHKVKQWYGDFSVGEESTISYYLGYVYLFQELKRDEDKVTISIGNSYKKFIDITTHDNKYYVMLSCKPKVEFVTAITDNLYKYGNVFAAYIKTIDESLPYPKKEDKVYRFAEIVETLNIRVIKIDSSSSSSSNSSSQENTDDWKGMNVQEIYKGSSASTYGEYVYIFYTPIKYG